MSADGWSICPACLHKAQEEKAALQAQVEAGYGVLTLEEFDALRAKAELPINEYKFQTFKEYYEFYIEDGVVHARYEGACTACQLSCDFTHDVPFWEKP